MAQLGRQGRKPSPPAETSYVRVTNLLRNEILSGQVPLGGWMRMTAIAERFGVSVQPVREALQQLEGEGLVELLPNRGARVRELNRERVIYSHEIGAALESFLARQFTEEASTSSVRQLETLQRAHDAAVADLDWPRVDATNFAFHRHINGYGGNTEAADLVFRYYGLSVSLMSRMGREPSFAHRVQSEHHALLDAIRRRDPDEAARISIQHVMGTRNMVLQAYETVRQATESDLESV